MAVEQRRVARHRGGAWALVALLIGLPHFAFSLYWAFGGTAMLDTVGGALADQARDGGGVLLAVAGVAAAFKLVATLLPLAAVRVAAGGADQAKANRSRSVGQLIRTLAWVEGLVLSLYGGVLTVVGLLVQVDVIAATADADHRALAWHAYFWDPWFMVWGICVIVALLLSRQRQPARRSRHGARAGEPAGRSPVTGEDLDRRA